MENKSKYFGIYEVTLIPKVKRYDLPLELSNSVGYSIFVSRVAKTEEDVKIEKFDFLGLNWIQLVLGDELLREMENSELSPKIVTIFYQPPNMEIY